jgi:hypothetical protein
MAWSSYSSRVSADATTLFSQAKHTAKSYMTNAQFNIDELFGEGYAANHPELVCAYMQTAAIDFATAILSARLQEIGNALEQGSKVS